MKLAFMGSPDFSVPALRALAAAHEVAVVYAQPPKPAGRGQRETPCPVHQAALALGLPVRTPKRLKNNEDEAEFLRALKLDAAIVAAYGLILPPAILAAPARGCLNIHASLLPRWRGAAPIQAAILAGDARTGITIMQMDAGLDTGDMLLTEATPSAPPTRPRTCTTAWPKSAPAWFCARWPNTPPPSAKTTPCPPTPPNSAAKTPALISPNPPPSWNAKSAPTTPGPARSHSWATPC